VDKVFFIICCCYYYYKYNCG